MTQAKPTISRPHRGGIETVDYQNVVDSPVDRILQKISKMDPPRGVPQLSSLSSISPPVAKATDYIGQLEKQKRTKKQSDL